MHYPSVVRTPSPPFLKAGPPCLGPDIRHDDRGEEGINHLTRNAPDPHEIFDVQPVLLVEPRELREDRMSSLFRIAPPPAGPPLLPATPMQRELPGG